MDNSIVAFQSLAARVEKLERQNRWMKQTGLAVFVIIIILPLMGQKQTTRTIEAEQFILRDAQGHERLTIGTPRISGAAVGLQPDEPAIWLDREAKAHAVLTSDGLVISNDKGTTRLEVSNLGPRIIVADPTGNWLWAAP